MPILCLIIFRQSVNLSSQPINLSTQGAKVRCTATQYAILNSGVPSRLLSFIPYPTKLLSQLKPGPPRFFSRFQKTSISFH